MLTDYFPPHVGGGVERVAEELCRGLVQRGHSVAVLTLRTRPAPSFEGNGDLTIRRVPAVDLTHRLGIQLALSVHILPAFWNLLRSFKPDVVHVHNLFFRTTEAASLLKLWNRVPLVATLHLGQMDGQAGMLKTLTHAYEATWGRLLVRLSDHVIAVSKAVAEHALGLGRGSRPLTVIPNGVDTRVFFPCPDPRREEKEVVLFVGRLVPNKGPETLVRAAPLVLERKPQARFVVVGDGPLKEHLQRQAHRLDVGHAVRFLGIRHDVPDLMREASLLVRPSTLEGMPLTVLEAMATGLPVVATPVGGTPELIRDGENGYLFPVGDSEAMAQRILRLLDTPSLAREMGSRGRRQVEASHTWEQVVEKTEGVYAQVVGL